MKKLQQKSITLLAFFFVLVAGFNTSQASEITSTDEPVEVVVIDNTSPDYPARIKVNMVNHSDWTVRFKFIYSDGSQSGWTSAKAHTSNSALSIDKPVKGVRIKWLDIATWKNIGGMGMWSGNGTSWNFTVSGKVFPPKPISIK